MYLHKSWPDVIDLCMSEWRQRCLQGTDAAAAAIGCCEMITGHCLVAFVSALSLSASSDLIEIICLIKHDKDY